MQIQQFSSETCFLYEHFACIVIDTEINCPPDRLERGMSDLAVVLNEDLHDNVLELNIQHGRYSLLLCSHESGAKYYTHIRHGHQIFTAVAANTINTQR